MNATGNQIVRFCPISKSDGSRTTWGEARRALESHDALVQMVNDAMNALAIIGRSARDAGLRAVAREWAGRAAAGLNEIERRRTT